MFELTNEQRECFAMTPVEASWKQILLQPSPYDQYTSYAYVDGNRIRKRIVRSDSMYTEHDLNERFDDMGLRTSRGKHKKLTAANLEQRTPVGMALCFASGAVTVFNCTTQQTYYNSRQEGLAELDMDGFRAWLTQWCQETRPQELDDIREFAQRERVHIRYREGDYFRFRLGRRHWGYGRILLDYGKLRKEGVEFWDIFMGKPLVAAVYHHVTEAPENDIAVLNGKKLLPSQYIMDNIFYYGECQIIGNAPLQPEEMDYPINYGRGISPEDEDMLMLQWGRTFLKKEHGVVMAHGFRNNAIGWTLNVTLPLLQACIQQDTNTPYWSQTQFYWIREDLRNPCFVREKRMIFQQFGLLE